jgi:hypothetical protein
MSLSRRAFVSSESVLETNLRFYQVRLCDLFSRLGTLSRVLCPASIFNQPDMIFQHWNQHFKYLFSRVILESNCWIFSTHYITTDRLYHISSLFILENNCCILDLFQLITLCIIFHLWLIWISSAKISRDT